MQSGKLGMPAHPCLNIMKSKSHTYFEKMKQQAQEQSDRMITLNQVFGFSCYIPDAPVTRSNRILDYSISKGLGPELKKVKKPKKVTAQPINYRENIKKLITSSTEPLSSVRVASMLGIAKSTAQSHLYALYEEGYLKRYALEALANRPLTFLYSVK